MKRILSIAAVTILLAGIHPAEAVMEDYCQVPPYVTQDVPPNVMIVVDNSGSMFNFAYYDGYHTTTGTDDNMCTNSGSPCTGFTNPGAYPTYKFYGYFNPDYWYTYSSNRFVPSDPKSGSGLTGSRAKLSTEWDGNFLNWLAMRRVDINRKALTGGKTTTGEGSGYDRLIGTVADITNRGVYKRIATSGDYTPFSGSKDFTFATGSGTSSFTVSGGGGSFNVAVRVKAPVEGVLQDVVGTKARVGLTFYKPNTSGTTQGGFIQVPVGGTSLSSTVNQINLTNPNSNTPLAETLWTVTGYYAQQTTIESGPGPRYSSGDFQVNNNNDPYNYGTGGSPRWPSCAKSFVLYITDGEPCADGNLPVNLRDYASGDSSFNCTGTSCPATVGVFPETYSFSAATFPSCTGESNSAYCGGVTSGCYVAGIEDVALYAHTTDLRNNGGTPNVGVDNISGKQNLTMYMVFAFGKGSTLLRYAAINGGFEDKNGNNMPDQQGEWDTNGDGEPDNFYEATDGNELEKAIRDALSGILKRASSGTAASVLASGEGSGANLIQAVFYPRRRFGNDIIMWNGAIQNLWYYVDPLFANSNIREDTVADSTLNLMNDYITQLYFDLTSETTKARLYADTDGNTVPDDPAVPTEVKDIENIGNVWEAGKLLWERDLTTTPRRIFTTVNGTSLIDFSTSNATTLRDYLQATDNNVNGSAVDDAERIIRYAHGEDITADYDIDGENDFRGRAATILSDTHVWKLGDILNSTPRISSWLPLGAYHKVYNDSSYGPLGRDPLLSDPPDATHYITTSGYKDRGMVFAGANDGMLHAFKLGKLELKWSGQPSNEKARLSGSDLGKEEWAFVPKNALPYLKYIGYPDYCHIYNVDLTPYLFDASIKVPTGCTEANYYDCAKNVESWRTVVIGGMRLGGGCKKAGSSCSGGGSDCVKTPTTDPGDSTKGLGYSSYFALDITDQNNPQLLWEFSDDSLGFATTGPSIVRISAKTSGSPDNSKNGRWFAVFGSGPTGPIDTTNNQFLGRSDQNLKLFIIDLKTGSLVRTIDTGIQNAFAGSMLNATNDTDKTADYQDDVVYIPYVKKAADSTWTQGGVIRLLTKEDTDPGNWAWSTVIDNVGPVTSSVARLFHKEKGLMWLYFGAGRYFYEQGGVTDDADNQRRLFGLKEPCYSSSGTDPNCTSTVTFATLTDVTNVANAPSDPDAAAFKGWYITLDPSGSYTYIEGGAQVTRNYRAERVITDPMATTSGMVFFTAYKPYNDECAIGGKSFIWAAKYDTGGSAAALLKGKALLQVSTGSVEQMDLGDAFKQDSVGDPDADNLDSKGGRRTGALEGVPPTAQGLAIMTTPPPVKRVIHIREK